MSESKSNVSGEPAVSPVPVNGAPNPAPSPASAPAPKMVKISKRIAAALRVGIDQGNLALAAVQAAEDRLKQARQALQSVASTNQGYVVALLEDAGQKAEDFANFGVWEENGEMYIRATPADAR